MTHSDEWEGWCVMLMSWPEGSEEERALKVYERLRELNPHLPPPDKVRQDWSIEMNRHAVPVVTIRVKVDLTGMVP